MSLIEWNKNQVDLLSVSLVMAKKNGVPIGTVIKPPKIKSAKVVGKHVQFLDKLRIAFKERYFSIHCGLTSTKDSRLRSQCMLGIQMQRLGGTIR